MDPTTPVVSGPNWTVLALGGSGLSCLFLIVVLYNAYVAFSMTRDAEAEAASNLAKGAWAVSLVAWCFGPCGVTVVGPIAVIMGRMVTGQVYREEASISSNTPAAMASINYGLLIVMNILFFALYLIGF